MTSVAVTELVRDFPHYRDAARSAPVAVVENDDVAGYFVSTGDFAEYQKLKARMTVALAAWELDEETIRALETVRMDPRHDHLNALMD